MRFRLGIAFFLIIPATAHAGTPDTPSCAALKSEIDGFLTHDYCRTSADCAAVDLPREFGCNLEVNKSAVPPIEEAYAYYNDRCGPFPFNCTAHARSIWCRKGRCDARITLDRRYPAVNPLTQHGRPFK